MQFEKSENKKLSLIKSVIEESKKIRAERGEDFYSEKKVVVIDGEFTTSKIQIGKQNESEADFKTLRDSHVKLAHLIVSYDKKIFEQNDQGLDHKKTRSKSVHLYIDEKIEHFLKTESEKADTKWGLRKNAGLGSLIQKFITNFIELKKREASQLKHIKKIIDDFRSNLVEFKKLSGNPNDYQTAERSNQKMKVLSNDLVILLRLLEFEDESLKNCLGADLYKWIDFVIKWKSYS
ncbi:MAG: hypothetical protein PHY93_19610 [Bacteriovorax sp.]|nr:hypothetical protein [Bacteriovorax sp.]